MHELALVLLAPLLTASGSPPPQANLLEALVVTGENNHHWELTSRKLVEMLEGSGKFRAQLTQDPSTDLADSGLLPISDRSADAVIAINAFLFPHEVARVLRVGGNMIWVNSSGERTPIYLSTEDVVAVLPFHVEGRESRAGPPG